MSGNDFKDGFVCCFLLVLILLFVVFICYMISMGGEESACQQVSGKPYCYQEWVAYDEEKK